MSIRVLRGMLPESFLARDRARKDKNSGWYILQVFTLQTEWDSTPRLIGLLAPLFLKEASLQQ